LFEGTVWALTGLTEENYEIITRISFALVQIRNGYQPNASPTATSSIQVAL